jgi:hypothetical protein
MDRSTASSIEDIGLVREEGSEIVAFIEEEGSAEAFKTGESIM